MHSKDENLYIIRASGESNLKQFKAAIDDYNKAIYRKPQNIRTYVERGQAYLGAGDKDSAMLDFNYALQLDSVNTFALFQKALLETDEEKYTVALKDMNRMIELAPYSTSAYFNRAMLKSKMKDYYGAINDYNAVININPEHILSYYNLAGLEYEHNDLQNSLRDYDRVIELYPEFADAYRNRAEVKKAMNNPRGAQLDTKKAGELQQMLSSASDSAKYYEGLKALKMMTLADDYEVSKDTKNKIQDAHFDIQPQPLFSVILFPATGNKVRTYDAAIKQHYGGSELTLFSKNDSMDARLVKKRFTELDTDISTSPGKGSYYAERGIIFTMLKAYDHALSDFDKAVDLDPFNALSYFSRANTRLKLLDLQRSDSPEVNAKLNSLSPQMVAGNSYEAAIADYSSALALDSTFSYAWYNRASARMFINDYNGALNDLTMAIHYEPTLAEAYYNKGLLLILKHQTETACTNLSKAGELGILEAYPVIKRYCDK